MPSQTDLLNDALGQIGAARITAIDDGSINANHCQTFYPALRRGLLRSHHWNFAEARVQLAQDAVGPVFEYTFSYTLPADLLKMKEYNGINLDTSTVELTYLWRMFKVEGRKLLSNDGEVKIVYVQDVTDPNLWDAIFYQTIAAWLASKLASAISKDAKLSQALLIEATRVLLPLALAVDGQESLVTPFIVDDLMWGR